MSFCIAYQTVMALSILTLLDTIVIRVLLLANYFNT